MSRSLIKGKFHGAVIRLAGCFSWPFRFADYSSGANLNRRSSKSCFRELLGFAGCSSVDAGAGKALIGKMDPPAQIVDSFDISILIRDLNSFT